MEMHEVESKIKDIEKRLDDLPDIIANKINTIMELKIQNATQSIELKFFKWIVPLCIGTIGSLIGVIFSYVK